MSAPRSANASAMARPMPRAAPVMTTTFFPSCMCPFTALRIQVQKCSEWRDVSDYCAARQPGSLLCQRGPVHCRFLPGPAPICHPAILHEAARGGPEDRQGPPTAGRLVLFLIVDKYTILSTIRNTMPATGIAPADKKRLALL